MKTLYLLRHAKSSWDDPALADFDRPLSARGRRACQRLGRYMGAELAPADLVLCSSARRTRETWEKLQDSLGWPSHALFERGVYEASVRVLLERLHAVEPDSARLLLIGHNPAIHELALSLTGYGASEARPRLAQKYPTGTLAEIAFDAAAWSGIDPGAGRLVRVVRPGDINKWCS